MIEKFQIPGVAGIIEKEELGIKKIIIQERNKKDAPKEMGLIEIPAGKIREYENMFDTLRREVLEETGLSVVEITGEDTSEIIKHHEYKIIGCEPFYVSQNLEGYYPIMIITFLCRVEGEMIMKSDESEKIRWISIPELTEMIQKYPDKFYPMHISALRKYLNIK